VAKLFYSQLPGGFVGLVRDAVGVVFAGAADLDVAAYDVVTVWVSRKAIRRFMLANQWSRS